jgi:hypothetical protein
MVVFLLHLKSCFRLTPFRREIAGAVIGENPVVGEKFRGAQESLRGAGGLQVAEELIALEGHGITACGRTRCFERARLQPRHQMSKTEIGL